MHGIVSFKLLYKSVAIERHILLWATVVGMYIFHLWFTAGELWLLDARVALWGFAPRPYRTLRDRVESGSLSDDLTGRGCVYQYVLM